MADFEKNLAHALQNFPASHKCRYGEPAEQDLLKLLFKYLTGNNEHCLRLLFADGPPQGRWKLAEAQGAREGAEYSESARGKRCGHIFKAGEASYRCSTCTSDDTCVLCSKCWDASDHTGHTYSIMLSSGNCGCCDCGDEEAWKLPLFCAIHTDTGESKDKKGKGRSRVPHEFVETMKMTIARVFDYFCDVISCSPEQLRLPKSEDGIKMDEVVSRLSPEWYGDGDTTDEPPEFAVVLWNDEKHTIKEVTDQVTRACRERRKFGVERANETHETGRSIVKHSKDLRSLLEVSRIIEQIKVTVTVRSSRDTFREQMCGTMIEWLLDIAGCSVGDDNDILRQIICEEMLKPWRPGSGAYNAAIGKLGLDDHEQEEGSRMRTLTLTIAPQAQLFAGIGMESDDDELQGEIMEDNGDEDREDDEDEYDETHEDLDDEGEDDEEAEEEEEEEDDDDDDQMEIDLQGFAADIENELDNDPDDQDIDMGTAEDELEIAEATMAGYPPPPPPPPRPQRVEPAPRPQPTHLEPMPDDSEEPSAPRHIVIPKTPGSKSRTPLSRNPRHWDSRSHRYRERSDLPAHEDLWQRTRLDWMILFDLRLWKQARTDLRDLYISTVVNIPQFKRILGLRFSALYTALAQLYLIADREPDHSIVNLSLQLLTTPSITEEVVERGNFLTNIMAILYTFLTTRQVGEPQDVSSLATLAFDAGSVTNRRLYHFFVDLRYLLQSGYVQNRIRTEEKYLLQFLDLVKLPQGICPNIRAVGEHVEYETDAWISASILMREINRLCRQFCESFRTLKTREDEAGLYRAISSAAVSTIINSVGAERKRFDQAEIKDITRFKSLICFDFEVDTLGQIPRHRVVDFVVEKGSISFHHALHYTLSWLLECGKSMPREKMRELLFKAAIEARDQRLSGNTVHLQDPEDILLAMFDYPLRVCAWLAQMKAGMWVRNGLSLRHQMSQYRGVSLRDVAYYRDIFLLQSALVTCNPSRVLASIADRFGMVDWMSRNYMVRAGYEDTQLVDIAEEFVHLLLILLTDRTCLTADDDSNSRNVISRDIAHVLCFKQLSFSDLSTRLSDRLLESDSFQDVLDEVATFRAPEGLNDTGTFELKPEYLDLVDPYSAHYTKNQRDEAENIFKNWMAKKTGKKPSDIVFEPKLRPILKGAFSDLPAFTKTPLFAQIIHHCLDYSLSSKECTPNIPITRVEAFLQVVLHLTLVSTIEDDSDEDEMSEDSSQSFISNALSKTKMTAHGNITLIGLLQKVSNVEEFQSCSPKIRHILKKFWQKRPKMYMDATATLRFPFDRIDADSPANAGESEMELKKKQALDRQARVMAQFQQQQQNFLNNQSGLDWGEEDLSDLESELRDTTETKLWKYPTGTCILCQEETTDSRLYGTFALVADSKILRQTDLNDPDFVREALNTSSSLDRSAEDARPFGVAGENREKVRRLDSKGQEVVNEKQGLSKGFPSKQAIRGPVTTGCGHIMHFSCFEVYYGATERRHSHQVSRNHPERMMLKEFVCPLCKALGNAFLPIIWKGKEESYPGVLATAAPFDQFVNYDLVSAVHRFRTHALILDSDNLSTSGHQKIFADYVSKNVISPISNKIEGLLTSGAPLAPGFAHARGLSMPGVYPTTGDDGGVSTSPLHQVSTPSDSPVTELVTIYKRLRETLRTNQVQTTFEYPVNMIMTEDLIHTDSLIKSFGYSISALEIAQRGVESSPGPTLLEKVPPLTLTHLRILAESAFSYASIGGLNNNAGSNRTVYEFREMHRRKLCQLFVGHPHITGLDCMAYGNKSIVPLLEQDTFIFLAECSLSLVPILGLDVHHIVHMCYAAEILKSVLAYMIKPQGLSEELKIHGDKYLPKDELEREQEEALARGFFEWITQRVQQTFNVEPPTGYPLVDNHDAPVDMLLMFKRLAAAYTLPFLRKTTILLHVQHGLEFPEAAGLLDPSISELDRLTKLLRLPTIDEIFASFAGGEESNPLDALASGWICHWNGSRFEPRVDDNRILGLSLPHPAIFELVGLPKYFDMLMEEANRRRCPNTGKELCDPSICLFCGDIFCSQAVCCLHNKLGGCNQHLDKCGKNIGLFINIRKCMVLYLVNRNGSWHFAPYLDRHGEVDPGLRRSRQLILNQKRYDRLLRDVWLSHGIPATVSRKLESEINNGGWESV